MEDKKSIITDEQNPWLLLIHQIPPKPDYFRVKIWRRLQRLGAVAIKNSVYALPDSEQTREDFQWTLAEIVAGGGEAMVCGAHLIDGLSNSQVKKMFQGARDRDYKQISDEAKKLAAMASKKDIKYEQRAEVMTQLTRLKKRLAENQSIDFFGAPNRKSAESATASVEALLRRPKVSKEGRESRPSSSSPVSDRQNEYTGRTWVTRKGIHIDRMASAWLIRRFIDQTAQFKFVPPEGYQPQPGEIRFDMFEAEFTHRGDHCTFEVLCEHFGLNDPALRVIAEIVHDIDLKDSKYGRQDTPGISRVIAGIAVNHKEDEERLSRGNAVFEDLYEWFRRQPASATGGRPPRGSRKANQKNK